MDLQDKSEKNEPPGLDAGLKDLRDADVLLICKRDLIGRSLNHLVKTTTMLSQPGFGLKGLTGRSAVTGRCPALMGLYVA